MRNRRIINALNTQQRGLCTGTLCTLPRGEQVEHVGCFIGALLIYAGEKPDTIFRKSMPTPRQYKLLKTFYDMDRRLARDLMSHNDGMDEIAIADDADVLREDFEFTNEERLACMIEDIRGANL